MLLFRRVIKKLIKDLVTVSNYFTLLMKKGLLDVRFVSTKQGKSVFMGLDYVYVTYFYGARPKVAVLSSNAVVDCVHDYGSVVVYEKLAAPSFISDENVFGLLERFHDDQIKSKVPLKKLLDSFVDQGILGGLKNRFVNKYGDERLVDICLCHGDVTKRNIMQKDCELKLIDVDDCFQYVSSFDYIYYQVAKGLENSDLNYFKMFELIGVCGIGVLHVNKIEARVSDLCEIASFDDYEYFLFFIKLVSNACMHDLLFRQYIEGLGVK